MSLTGFVGLLESSYNLGGFSYKRPITIDFTQVGSSDLINLPVLVQFTDPTLKTVGNGGRIQTANGFDIGFYEDSGLTTKLNWEVELYIATTGQIIAWVQVPNVSHTVNTVFYMGYDSALISTDRSNKTGVWGPNAVSILHFGNTASLSIADSSVQNIIWNSFSNPSASVGLVNGGMAVKPNQYITSSNNLPTAGLKSLTVSFWFRPPNFAADWGLFQWANAPRSEKPAMLIQLAGTEVEYYADGNYQNLSQHIVSGTWYQFGVSLANGTTWKFFLTGTLLSTYTGGTAFFGTDTFGNLNNSIGLGDSFNGFTSGSFDELHVFSGTTLPDSRFLAEYNNLKSGSTMVTVGAETPT